MPFHVHNPEGWVKGRRGYIKTPDGWKLTRQLHRKSGASTWTLEESMDTQGPGLPALVGLTTDSTNKRVTVVARMPGDADLARATLKYDHVSHPLWEYGDDNIGAHTDLVARQDADPWENITWSWSPTYYDRRYYVSIWAVDSNGNPSDRRRVDFLIPSPTAAPPPTSPPPVKLTYNAVESGSIDRVGTWAGNWSSWAGELVIQAGVTNLAGAWLYGTKIKSGVGTRQITKMTVRVQRVNSAHGVSSGANVYLVPHKLSAKTGTYVNAAAPVKVGALLRGDTKVFPVPTAWWPHFASGNYKGLGLWTPSGSGTPWTSADYLQSYGRGTTSGQVYIEAS